MKSKFSQRFFSPTRKPIYMDLENPIFRIYSPTSISSVQPSSKLTSFYNPRQSKPKLKIRNLLVKKIFVFKNSSPNSISKSKTPVSRLIEPRKSLGKNLESSIFKSNYKQRNFNPELLLRKKVRVSPVILPSVSTSKKQKQVINLVDLIKYTGTDEDLSDRDNANFDMQLPSLAYRSHDP